MKTIVAKLINNNNNNKKPNSQDKSTLNKQERKSEKERILLGRVKQQERTTMRENLEEAVENNKRWKGRDSWGSDSPKDSQVQTKSSDISKGRGRDTEKVKGGTKWKKYGESSETAEKSPNVSAKKFDRELLWNYEKCRWRIEEKKYIKTTINATEYSRMNRTLTSFFSLHLYHFSILRYCF